ncbi:MAG: pitrilysin family protein [Methylococcaceae bacterium]|nr:pitrilysin family protein [Methylococcaceae bacterium]MDZ4157795.1 pitrilysin family protein [Methylococcales bacterium]MDP2392300.1 pitrilysin family protein [Methylococcaceae bacterium]MDP3021194.1 pitrilysin family protein [Methylococcaceae bacterium]MDP3391626.1 pitrilysin family protein [Methylococcaceae bacterium]
MRIRMIGLMLLAFSQTVWSTAKIENWQTPQGSRVFYVHTEGLPMVDIQVAFDAGSARDDYQFGLASLTSSLLDTGAGPWNADDIAQRFESVGANFGTGISRDMAWVSLRTLTDKPLFDKALDTAQAILAKPSFNQADFEREKNRTLAGLKQEEESPGELAGIAFFNTLYGDHPYAHPTDGTIVTVSGFSVDDLRNFYRKYYVAANAIVVIVGDLSKQQAEQTAEKLLKDLPVGQKPAPIPDVSALQKSSQQHIEFPSAQTHVLVGLPGSYRKDPDYFSLYVGNHILGGGGLVSKLFDEVREKRGLAYGASSSFAPLAKPGPFIVSLQTRNDQTTQALQVVNQTLNDYINNGPTEAELTAAKQNITGGFAMRFDTNKELVSYVAMIGFYDMPLDYLDKFQQNVEQVTVASIKDAFKRRVKPKLLQTITVGQAAGKSGK